MLRIRYKSQHLCINPLNSETAGFACAMRPRYLSQWKRCNVCQTFCHRILFIRMDAEINLVKKKHTKSTAWNFFGLKADEDGVPIPSEEFRPICKICRKSVACKSGNTTNLFAHLRDRHPQAYKEANQSNNNINKASTPSRMEIIKVYSQHLRLLLNDQCSMIPKVAKQKNLIML